MGGRMTPTQLRAVLQSWSSPRSLCQMRSANPRWGFRAKGRSGIGQSTTLL